MIGFMKTGQTLLTCSSLKSSPAKRRKRPERALHRACAYYLSLVANADSKLAWYPIPNGMNSSPRHVAIMKQAGELIAGIPDLGIVYDSRSYFVELKADKNTLTKAQKTQIEVLQRAGARVYTVRSVDELTDVVRDIRGGREFRLEV